MILISHEADVMISLFCGICLGAVMMAIFLRNYVFFKYGVLIG